MAIPWHSTHLDRRDASVEQVATDSLGLYVSPPVSHLELAARLAGYRPADLEVLLRERRLVGLRTLRGSAFLMPVELLPIVVPATRERNVKAFASFLRRRLSTATYEQWTNRVLEVLGPGESLTKSEITARLDPPGDDRPLMTNVISQMATESRLVGVRVPVSWRSAKISYTRWEDWLGGVDVESPDRDEARVALARLYLGAFGPASIEDFAWWSGLTKAQARSAFVASDATSVGDLFAVGEVGGDRPSGARLLPIWDTLFVTWKDRSRFIPGDLLPFIYDASGNATSVVLLEGEVAGVWAMGADDDPLDIKVASFGPLSDSSWSMIEDEAHVVARLSGAASARVHRIGDPPNLKTGKRNLFMRPV